MSGLTASAIFYRIVRRFGRHSSYRGALINTGLKHFEVRLFAALWAAVALPACFTGLQLYNFFAEGEQPHSSGRLQATVPLAMPTPPLATAENKLPVFESKPLQSMFHLKETAALPPPVVKPQHEENEVADLTTPPVQIRHPIWQLEIFHSNSNTALLEQQLAYAQDQLQAGHFEHAHLAYEYILAQDPHHVGALAGMLLSNRVGRDQQQDYLNRLSQEVPNYRPDDAADMASVRE